MHGWMSLAVAWTLEPALSLPTLPTPMTNPNDAAQPSVERLSADAHELCRQLLKQYPAKVATRALLSVVTLLTLVSDSSVVAADSQPTVELRVGDDKYEGRIADRGKNWCVLYDRSGRMHTIDLKDVTKFRRVSARFSPHTFRELRPELLNDFGKGYEVSTTRHYIVCAPTGMAREYVDVFEQTWRRFHMYFAVRGFKMPDPEFPLIAVILKSQRDFMQFAHGENARVGAGVLGYYWSRHNRVIMYEDRGRNVSALPGSAASAGERLFADALKDTRHTSTNPFVVEDPWAWAFGDSDEVALRSGINADLRETMVHEATHQLGYNMGLHNRTGSNPKWIVEGLATVFETPGMEKHATARSAIKRVNVGWLYGFRKFVDTTRPESYLEQFIRDDAPFNSDMSNAYAQAWALSFWLIESRPRKYAEFLKRMASPAVSGQLTAQRRVNVFRESFGDNLRMLDIQMLRYFERLK